MEGSTFLSSTQVSNLEFIASSIDALNTYLNQKLPLPKYRLSHAASPFVFTIVETTTEEIRVKFKELTTDRKDVAIVIITQIIAEKIRDLINSYEKTIPTVLEIPDKSNAYDESKDTLMQRILQLKVMETYTHTHARTHIFTFFLFSFYRLNAHLLVREKMLPNVKLQEFRCCMFGPDLLFFPNKCVQL